MSQVNPEDVKAFLSQQEQTTETTDVTTEPQMPGHEVINLEELRKEQEKRQEEVSDLNKKVDEDRSKLFEPDKASLAHLSSWVFASGEFKVDVDAHDKALYIKSILNDVPLELSIRLELGISMQIRSTTNYDLDVIFKTLEQFSEDNKVPGPAQYATLVQKCAAAIQIIKIGDKLLNPPTFVYGQNSIEDDAKILRDRIDKTLGGWGWPKWNTAITALRIFEAKLALCNENARQATFWQTAGAN